MLGKKCKIDEALSVIENFDAQRLITSLRFGDFGTLTLALRGWRTVTIYSWQFVSGKRVYRRCFLAHFVRYEFFAKKYLEKKILC